MDDKFKFPDFFEPLDTDGDVSAHGIVQCLRMLADEATALGLGRTVAALRAAMTVCADEGEAEETDSTGEDDLTAHPAGSTLH